MPSMRKPAVLVALMFFTSALCFGQTTSSVTDVNEITKRILSSTRYRLTPGDTYLLIITLGGEVSTYTLVLQENYDLDVPWVGTLQVKGMYFTDLRKLVSDELNKKLPKKADYISLVLQSPARFDVPVYGGVESPGVVTLNPLSRVSDAIALSKGIRKGGSTRQIQLIRGNSAVTVDLLLYGLRNLQEANPYLQPGDSVFVPQAAITASVTGQVVNPGVYELVPGESLTTLLSYAGGILAEAYPGTVQIQRFNPDGTTSRITVDLKKDSAVMNGDRVRVPPMTENKETVLVVGALFGAPVSMDKPNAVPAAPISVEVPFVAGLTLLDVLESLGGPTPYAKADQSAVIRSGSGQRVMVDVETLWATRSELLNIALQPGDTVSVPIILDVFVAGEVRSPGKVPYSPAFTVSDYIMAAGGVSEDTGDANAVYFIDAKGKRARATPMDAVKPGSLIFVDKNGWTQFQSVFNDKVFIVTGIVTTILGLVTYALGFIAQF
jgi:polysaccharide export outer membrane protein